MQLSRTYKLVDGYQEKEINLLKNNLKYIDTYQKLDLDNWNSELTLFFDVNSGEEAGLVKEVSRAIKSSGIKLKAKTPFTKPGEQNTRREKLIPVNNPLSNDYKPKM